MKRILAFVLVVLMLCTSFVACGDDPANNTDEATTTPAVTVDPNLPDLPDPSTVDIAGEFNILASGNYALGGDYAKNDFISEGETDASTVEIAIYRRNEKLKELYGVDIVVNNIAAFGSTNGGGKGFTEIYMDYMSGDSEYDAAQIGTYDVATLAYSGYIHDLNDIPHIDLTKSYWDQKANADLSINGVMMYTSGDIAVINNMATHAILFNKKMISEYDLTSPYTLVEDDNWTIETFSGLVKQIGEDVNLDGVYNESDLYGLLTWNDPMIAILAAAGEKIGSINENGLIELTFYNERVVNLYDQFEDLVFDASHVYNYQYDNVTGAATPSAVWNTNRDAIFTESRAAFYLNTLATVERHRDSDVDFGILPYPKLDANQENYGHNVSPYHAAFICVPELAPDYERTGIVLEALAYYGEQILTPAYYDQTLIGKSIRDEDSVDMLDIIFDTRVYDVGAYYNLGTYKDQLGRIFVTRTPITSMYETYKASAEQKVATINEIMSELH